ncbi:hypothetical protein V2J09_020971 [Rumex salicifolius]
MGTWSWSHRERNLTVKKIQPLMRSWTMHLKRHPGRSMSVGTKATMSPWELNMLNKISIWEQDIKVITWNVQGAGSREIMIKLKEHVRIHDPTILILLEKRMSGLQADKVCDTIGFEGRIRAEAAGFRGRIWVLWRKALVTVSEVDVHHQAVTFDVVRNGEDAWLMSAIYASPNPRNWEELWNCLLGINSSNSKP